jgi:hypothetical protein
MENDKLDPRNNVTGVTIEQQWKFDKATFTGRVVHHATNPPEPTTDWIQESDSRLQNIGHKYSFLLVGDADEEIHQNAKELSKNTGNTQNGTGSTMNSSRLEATQSLRDATSQIALNCTEAECEAVERISNPREPHIVEANFEMMLANLVQLEPEWDWVERFMERVFTNPLVQNAEAAQLRAKAASLQPPCRFCQRICSTTDRGALRKVFDTGGNPVIEACFLCTNRKQKFSYKCCKHLQYSCIECVKR